MKFVITICLTHNLLLPTIWVQPFISKCCWLTLWCDVSSTVSVVFSVCFIIIFNLTQKRTSPLLVGHAKCHCVNKPGLYKQQVWPDWDIWKFLASNFITKEAQIFGDFLCYFEKWHFLGKNCFDFYIWSTCRNLGYFIFHLVTLLDKHQTPISSSIHSKFGALFDSVSNRPISLKLSHLGT